MNVVKRIRRHAAFRLAGYGLMMAAALHAYLKAAPSHGGDAATGAGESAWKLRARLEALRS